MPNKDRRNEPRRRPDTDVSRQQGQKNRKTNNSDNNTGEMNRGNTMNTGYNNQQTDDLHTKKSVSGSDADGQAE